MAYCDDSNQSIKRLSPSLQWGNTEHAYLENVCVHEFFEQQTQHWGSSVAVEFGNQKLSYAELNGRANQLARHLRRRGVGRDSLVGLCFERSLEMYIGLLGVLKAGAAYLPLDPAYPKDRLAYLIEDAQSPVLLTQEVIGARLPASSAEIISLDKEWASIQGEESGNLEQTAQPEDLAYVIYTSGSTGRPKGVCLLHRALVNMLCWQLQQSTVGREERTLQYTSLSFDVSFQEIFSTWCAGGTLVTVSESVRRDAVALLAFLAEQKIARLFLPFVGLQQLAASAEARELPKDLREVITAGEQLRITPHIAAFFARLPNCALYNHYGPSESHVVTSYKLEGHPNQWDALPPIGKPISNTYVRILSPSLEPVGVGDIGELYIGGVALARGYHNRPDLTAERFIADPSAPTPGSRLYKTGDLCRYLSDGNIQYIGRTDNQVKIRGYRIELGEIESLLATYPGLQQCAVIAREDSPGEKKLVGYVVPARDRKPVQRALREFLAQKLPEYMIPSTFVILDSLPLTPSGKLDRNALPPPNRENSLLESEFVPPRDQLEKQLVEIWEIVLGIRPIGIMDNIFDLGVDSLIAARLFTRIEKVLGKDLPPASLLQAPTIQTLAKLVRGDGKNEARRTSLVVIQPTGPRTPLFCVHGGDGSVFSFRDLAMRLAPERPVYGFQSQGLYGVDVPHYQVEEMAAHYIQEMRTVQPHGPYLLGGWCFGGLVVFEMAQQLRRAGEVVELLAMFHAVTGPEYNAEEDETRPLHARVDRHWRQVATLPSKEKLKYISARIGNHAKWRLRQLRHRWTIMQRRALKPARKWIYRYYRRKRSPLPAWLRRQQFIAINAEAEREYIPQTYPGSAVIFRYQGNYPDPYLGWSRFVQGAIEAHEIPVREIRHRALIQEPAVGVIAHKIEEYLAREGMHHISGDQNSYATAVSKSELETNVTQ